MWASEVDVDREETVVKKRKYKVQDRKEHRGKGLRQRPVCRGLSVAAGKQGFSGSISQADPVEHHG